MCLAWLSQLMGVTVVHANLRHWLKLFYASICTFVLFGLDQVPAKVTPCCIAGCHAGGLGPMQCILIPSEHSCDVCRSPH